MNAAGQPSTHHEPSWTSWTVFGCCSPGRYSYGKRPATARRRGQVRDTTGELMARLTTGNGKEVRSGERYDSGWMARLTTGNGKEVRSGERYDSGWLAPLTTGNGKEVRSGERYDSGWMARLTNTARNISLPAWTSLERGWQEQTCSVTAEGLLGRQVI